MIRALKNKKVLIKTLILSLVILFIAFLLSFEAFRDIIFIVIVSCIFSYILKPLYVLLKERININKRFLAMIIILSVIFVILFFLVVLIPSIFKEGKNFEGLINSTENFINELSRKIKLVDIGVFQVIEGQFTERLNIFLGNFTSSLINNLVDFSENILAIAVIPVLSYYFLAYGDLLSEKFLYLFPIEKRTLLGALGKDVDRILGKYILGQLILSLVVGVMTFFAMVILKVKFPLLLALFNALLNIIPYFGAVLGGIPAIIVALASGSKKIFLVLISFFIIQQIEGNLIAPKITAESIDMHPIFVIILLLIGEKIGGLLGMIFIVPIAVIIKVLIEDFDNYMFL